MAIYTVTECKVKGMIDYEEVLHRNNYIKHKDHASSHSLSTQK